MTDPRALIVDGIQRLAIVNSIDEAGQILASWGHAIGNVLDLHSPYTGPGADDAEPVCGGCIHDPEDRDEDGVPWPCPTVAAITTALEDS